MDDHQNVVLRTGRGSDSLAVRFPAGVRPLLKALAARNRRTMNAEAVLAIEHWLALAKLAGRDGGLRA